MSTANLREACERSKHLLFLLGLAPPTVPLIFSLQLLLQQRKGSIHSAYPPADREDTRTSTATITAYTTTTVAITSTFIVDDVIPPTIVTAPLHKRNDAAALVRHASVSLAPRQMTVKPSTIPTYASACSGAAGYSSACSCIGVTAAQTTVAAPSTTITITSTSIITVPTSTSIITATLTTNTVIATSTVACANFLLQAVGGGDGVDGEYVQVADSGDGFDDEVIYFVSDTADATVLDIAVNGQLNANGYIANSDAGSQEFLLYFNTPSDITSFGYAPATCSITPASTLQCVDGAQDLFEICMGVEDSGGGVLFASEEDSNCIPVSFNVISSC